MRSTGDGMAAGVAGGPLARTQWRDRPRRSGPGAGSAQAALGVPAGPVGERPAEARPAAAQGGAEEGCQVGYRGPTACAASGVTYRQLDYWARTGLVEPGIRPGYGSGAQRLYSFRDVVVLKIVKRLLDTGVSLQNIRTAVHHLRARTPAELARMTLMSDGATVYECTSPDEVVDLLQGGQGIFGIAVGVVWRDVEAALSELHGERVDTGETLAGHNPADELARRRGSRAV